MTPSWFTANFSHKSRFFHSTTKKTKRDLFFSCICMSFFRFPPTHSIIFQRSQNILKILVPILKKIFLVSCGIVPERAKFWSPKCVSKRKAHNRGTILQIVFFSATTTNFKYYFLSSFRIQCFMILHHLIHRTNSRTHTHD